MIFEIECDTTKDELTDRTEHTMIVPFIVLDLMYSIEYYFILVAKMSVLVFSVHNILYKIKA